MARVQLSKQVVKLALAAAVLVGWAAGGYFIVERYPESKATRVVKANLGHLLDRAVVEIQQGASNLTELITVMARRPRVAVALAEEHDEVARRGAAFDECEAITSELALRYVPDIVGHASPKLPRGQRSELIAKYGPDVVAIVDAQGRVVSRNLHRDAMYAEDLRTRFPPVEAALRGAPAYGVVNLAGRMTLMAAAPVTHSDGKLLGVLIVGYVVSARDAWTMRDRLGADVAYFAQGEVQTSSFTEQGPNIKEDGNKTRALSAVLFQGTEKPGAAVMERGITTAPFRITLDGKDLLAIAAPLDSKNRSAGLVVLQSPFVKVSSRGYFDVQPMLEVFSPADGVKVLSLFLLALGTVILACRWLLRSVKQRPTSANPGAEVDPSHVWVHRGGRTAPASVRDVHDHYYGRGSYGEKLRAQVLEGRLAARLMIGFVPSVVAVAIVVRKQQLDQIDGDGRMLPFVAFLLMVLFGATVARRLRS